MFRNYLKIAVRNLWKSKGFSAINIIGLAAGLATCLMIALFVTDELGYDRHHQKADRIVRLASDIHINGSAFRSLSTPAPMGPTLAREYPGVEKYVRIAGYGEMLVKRDQGNETIMEKGSAFADSTFFEVFTVPLVAGDPVTALKEPFSMVISETMAKKYFNSADVIGKTLLTSNTITYKITGVMKDMPAASHFHFSFLKAMSEIEASRGTEWLSNNYVTYLLLRNDIGVKQADSYLNELVLKYLEPQLRSMFHTSLKDLGAKGDFFHYASMPVAAIHLHSNYADEFEANGSIQYVYIFIVVGIFILLIACVNFMNLSTARSAGRSKEIGVRKVLGSRRKNIILQFLTEATLTSLISMLLAIFITALMLPYFNQLSGKQIALPVFFQPLLLASLLGAALLVGMIAGSYPAFYMSAFQPIQTLKGKLAAGFKNGWLRNGLVVFQFSTAILLIIGTLIIHNQLKYIRSKELGYNRQQLLTIQNTYSLWIHAKPFMSEVKKLQGVVGATMTRNIPNRESYSSNAVFKDATMRATGAIIFGDWIVDSDFFATLGMSIAKGRNFSAEMPTDSSSVLINETGAAALGYSDPLGKTLYWPADNNGSTPYRIIGVVKDFHSGSLHSKIAPMIFRLGEERGAITFRIDSKNIPALINRIEQKYRSVEKMAGQPFLYSFMDDDFNRLYHADERTGRIFISFAILAILIACLGLFGLVTYAAEQRTKEFGIRKTLGAGMAHIVSLLSRDFIRLVVIASLISFPIAWWAMSRWLRDFAYRTNISVWSFVIAGGLAICITIITIGVRAVKTARANPVDSLRTE